MAKPLRPRMLAAAFGAYFALIAVASYMNASSLSGPWYRGDLTRWVYMSYLVGAAALLAGAGAVAVIRIQYIDRRLAEMNEAIEAAGATGLAEAVRIPADAADVLPPPLQETPSGDQTDKDIDDLLESLSEMETTTAEAVAELEHGGDVSTGVIGSEGAGAVPDTAVASLVARRDRARRARKSVLRFLGGPIAASVVILGISGAMLPAADGMLQSYHQLNTALILGIGYGWLGVGAYFAAALAGILKGK